MNFFKNSLILLLLTPILLSAQMTSKKTQVNGSVLIYGETNIDQIFFDYPTWKRTYDMYSPDSATSVFNKSLLSVQPKITLEIYLGTWCPDSKREVSNFFKMLDAYEMRSEFDITIYGLDRRKQMEGNLVADRKISRVPTFVFIKNGNEFGRITEYPKVSLEKDMNKVLRVLARQ